MIVFVRLFLAVAIFAAALPPVLEAESTVVGSKGVVYKLREGTLGTLFPETAASVSEHPALALDVLRSDGTTERLLVPGTDGPEIATDPGLALQGETGVPFVIWVSRLNIHSVIYLVGLTEDGWTDPVMLSGHSFSIKSHPQLVPTTTRVAITDDAGGVMALEHTAFHVVWWDDGAVGRRALYTMVVLSSEGRPQPGPILALSEFLTPADPGTEQLPLGLEEALRLQAGRGEDAVVVAFADAHTARLATLEISLLPKSLSWLAEEMQERLLRDATGLPVPSQQELANKARAEIVILGARYFQPDLLEYLADRVAAAILAAPSGEPTELAERARAELVILGVSLRNAFVDPRARAEVVILGARSSSYGEDSEAGSDLLAVRTISIWDAPQLPEQPLQLFVSRSGEQALLAWDAVDGIHYVETDGKGWSEPSTLTLHEDLDRSSAYQLLSERIDSR